MIQPGRKYSATDSYRYGFGGQEKSIEINSDGNSMTAEFWQYDARIGRRWNVDPILKDWESPYAAFSNNPIINIDPLGNSDSTVTAPNGNSFTLPESARITKQSHAYTNSSGVQYQHTAGAVESFVWRDLEYKAYYNSKTGEFTGYKAQLGEQHNFQKLAFSYGAMDKLLEWVKSSSSNNTSSNQIDQYRAWRGYPGYHSGETFWDRTFRNINNSHIEIMLDYGGGGYNMWGGYGRLGAATRTFYTVQSEADAARLLADGGAWPLGATRAHLGPGVYAWATEAEATAYLTNLSSRGVEANLKIVQIQISGSNLAKLSSFVVPAEDQAANAWLQAHSSLYGSGIPHGYQYVQRATSMGMEHYFSSNIFNLFKVR